MTNKSIIHNLVEEVLSIENEIKTLQESKKDVLDAYKDKLDIKVFNAAMRIARIKAKLTDTSDETLDEVLTSVEDKICINLG